MRWVSTHSATSLETGHVQHAFIGIQPAQLTAEPSRRGAPPIRRTSSPATRSSGLLASRSRPSRTCSRPRAPIALARPSRSSSCARPSARALKSTCLPSRSDASRAARPRRGELSRVSTPRQFVWGLEQALRTTNRRGAERELKRDAHGPYDQRDHDDSGILEQYRERQENDAKSRKRVEPAERRCQEGG